MYEINDLVEFSLNFLGKKVREKNKEKTSINFN